MKKLRRVITPTKLTNDNIRRNKNPHVISTDLPQHEPTRYIIISRAHHIVANAVKNKKILMQNLQANAVQNELTGNMEEYRHLVRVTDKVRW